MLDQLKTTLEKLYLKNVNFSSGETITSIPQMDKLKSGIFINRKFVHLTVVVICHFSPQQSRDKYGSTVKLIKLSPLNVRLIKSNQ